MMISLIDNFPLGVYCYGLGFDCLEAIQIFELLIGFHRWRAYDSADARCTNHVVSYYICRC